MRPTLLHWQLRALELYKTGRTKTPGSFVLVAGTGTGKTMAAAACVNHTLGQRPDALVLIGVPTRSVKRSWARTLRKFNITASTRPQDTDGDTVAIITTYAGASAALAAIEDEAGSRPLILVMDEFHHLETNGDWRKPFEDIGREVVKTLLLSGTPWHESGDLTSIVEYDDPRTVVEMNRRTGKPTTATVREVKYDFKHTYGENVNAVDGDCNTVAIRFKPASATVEVQKTDKDTGEIVGTYTAHTEDTCRSDSISPFVRFASYEELLSERCGHIRELIDNGVAQLTMDRRTLYCAAGIVFVSGREEGDAVKTYLLRKHGRKALFVFSDDPRAHGAIEEFECDVGAEWIIAMDMISEGTDIPRLKVAVDLSWKTTLLHILQRWGRVLRLLRMLGDKPLPSDTVQIPATIFFFNHAQLQYVADMIEDDCKKHEAKGGGDGPPPPTSGVVRQVIKGDAEFKDTVYKGLGVKIEVDELALWIVDVNYKGIGTAMGYHSALWTAKMMLLDDTVPVEFSSAHTATLAAALRNGGDHRTDAEKLPGQKAAATKAAKSTLAKLVEEFYVGDYSTATIAVNREHGVESWSNDNKTLAQLEARADSVARVLKKLREGYAA